MPRFIYIHKCDSSTRADETPKRKKFQFRKKEASFNSNHSSGEPKKSRQQPLKSKTLVPLKVHVIPAPLKGVLKCEKNKTVGNKRVSFDCEPEIRYRTASEASSTSTLKSMQSLKEVEDNGLRFNRETAKKRYSSEMQMSANKSVKPKSEVEKKFDDLLNDKCSWTYKSIKTFKCQTSGQNDENGPTLKIRTVNIEETAYNRDSHPKNSFCSLAEYDYIETDKKKKAKKIRRKSRSSKIAELDWIQENLNTSKPKETFDESTRMDSIVKLNKRNLKSVSYAESDSSSDDGIVFLTRRYDERIVNGTQCEDDDTNFDISEIEQENSSNIYDDSNYNTSDYNNDVSQTSLGGNYAKIDNFKASDKQRFKPQGYDEINATVKNSDQEEGETHFEDQDNVPDFGFDDDYKKSYSSRYSVENRIPGKEMDLAASETLSSLSENDSNKIEENNEKAKTVQNVNSKNDLNSELIQQFMTVSKEVQAVCNDLESLNNYEEDEIVSDFFSGNFDLEKYKSKINSDKTASISTEMNVNGDYNFELLNETRSDDSPKRYPDRGMRSNEETGRHATRRSNNSSDITEKCKELGNKLKFKNKSTSTVRNSVTRVKKHTSYFQDRTSSEQSNGDEAGNEYSVTDSPKICSESRTRSSEKIQKRTNRNSGNAKDTQEKCKETNFKNKNALNLRKFPRLKEQHTLYFDSDDISSQQSNEDETGNDLLGGNENSLIDSKITYSDSGILSNEIREHANKNSGNANDTKRKGKESDSKINFKNENASNVRKSLRVKKRHTSYFDRSDYTSSEQSDENDTRNNALEEKECSAIEDYFKENSFNIRGKSKPDAKLEQNVENTNTCKLLDKRDTKFKFPKQYDVTQQSATSKMEIKENTPLNNTKGSSGAKCAKKRTPKTWEDLEADIFNREEQISFFPFFDIEPSAIGEAFLKNDELHQTGMNKSRTSSHKSDDNFETTINKTQSKQAIVKSIQGNSGQLASARNVNNDITFESPNASIIDRVIRRMQMCTSPVLMPSKGMPQKGEYQKSPILTEYSYSVQETKSVYLTTEKKLNEKLTRQSKTTYKRNGEKGTLQKNYRLCKKRQIKTVMNPKGAKIMNQTSVKLNEIPRKMKRKLSKSSESDDGLPESNETSEMKNSTPESDDFLLSLQDTQTSNVDGSYNLRKRKPMDNAYREKTIKKQNITKVNNATKSNSIAKYEGTKTNKRGKQNISPVIETSTGDDASTENFTSINKRKRGNKNKSNFMNSSTDESESEDLFQNGAASIDYISDKQDKSLEKSNGNLKLSKISNKGASLKTNALLSSENTKAAVQSSQKQGHKKMKTVEKPKQDSKEEYEKYLQKLFRKDIIEDFNVQLEFPDGTIETVEKKVQQKDESYSSRKKLPTSNSDEELLSLSSDTESEAEKPSPRRASGLLDDVFNEDTFKNFFL